MSISKISQIRAIIASICRIRPRKAIDCGTGGKSWWEKLSNLVRPLESLPQSKPQWGYSMIVKQTNKLLLPHLNKYGCRFMSLLAIPQVYTGDKLSPTDINGIFLECSDIKRTDPKWFAVKLENAECGSGEHEIINAGFRLLDSDATGVQVGYIDSNGLFHPWFGKDVDYDFVICHWITGGPDGHWTLWNKDMEEIYDPWDAKDMGYEIKKVTVDKRYAYRVSA